ncbi:folate-sensitive fragile site protein Fra10Ac1-domain-containing protein [Daedaleopsis nitida]|nr:folate-sensitive fragile site protein Fra10Ac1-domain-containing protein [Daedaleopsis nitida]
MALYTPYTSKDAGSSRLSRSVTTEFDILHSSHKFLREDDDRDDSQLSWNEKLAKKYYSSLFREYAVCDLKHYKSGNFALRWRTEEEVLSGSGETTCGNTRCPLHKEFPDAADDVRPALTTLELPFSYTQRGESKFALVKVVLCAKCFKKLMWKRNKDKEELIRREARNERPESSHGAMDPTRTSENRDAVPALSETQGKRRGEEDTYDYKGRTDEDAPGHRRRRNSRSRSPRRSRNGRHRHDS